MIVSCENCNKKFNVPDDLIPASGRLLQCGSCNHKWFYKLTSPNTNLENENIQDLNINETIINEEKKIIKKNIESSLEIEKKEKKSQINKTIKKNKKSSNLIKKTFVLIISIVALIILIDTFKFQLEKYIPEINLLLNNLYETLKDFSLFIKDLIK